MRKILLPLLLVSVAGCNTIPPEAYYDRAAPESLLDQSSEVVNFELMDAQSVDEMVDWINQDQPSRAELSCDMGGAACSEAEQALNQFGVPVEMVPGHGNSVTLMYERVLARDCENRYIDNSINPYNLTHPTYGCSIAVNMVQMITDKRQLTSPPLLGYMDGLQTQRTMDAYRVPYESSAPKSDPNFEPQFDIQTSTE
jgi:hypothetical protein